MWYSLEGAEFPYTSPLNGSGTLTFKLLDNPKSTEDALASQTICGKTVTFKYALGILLLQKLRYCFLKILLCVNKGK